MQIDVLVKNEKHVKLKKNIGRIFRQYNIIEYKSPEDGSGTGRQRHILPHRDAIPIQLVIVQKLSKEHNYWLNNLRNDLKAGSEIKKNYRVVKKQNYSYQMSIIKNQMLIQQGLSKQEMQRLLGLKGLVKLSKVMLLLLQLVWTFEQEKCMQG